MTDWQWFALGLAALAVVVGGPLVLFRVFVGPIVGPMFRYELVRLSRRGAIPKLRALLVALLFLGLFLTYLREFPVNDRANFLFGGEGAQLSIDQTAKFGNNFFIAFMAAQLATVMLITPAVAGSAISEEKERGTFEYLQVSMLTNREIVLGKLAARMVYVGGVVLAGVPVLSLTALFGGVDFRVMFAGYAVTAITALSLGAFSIHQSVHRESLKDVLVWVYGVTAVLSLFGLCCGCIPGVGGVSPISVLVYMFADLGASRSNTNPGEWEFWFNILSFAAIHLPAAILFTLLSVSGIRKPPPVRRRAPKMRYVGKARRWNADDPPRLARRPERPPPPPPRDESPWEDNREYVPMPRARRSFWVPHLNNGDPFLWKERFFVGKANPNSGLTAGCGIGLLISVLFAFGLALFIAVSTAANNNEWIGGNINPVVRVFLTAFAMVLGLALATRAAASVAYERQKQTLTALLTIPVSRTTILQAKWLAPFVWTRYVILAVALTVVATLVLGGVHPVGFVVSMTQVVGFLLFATTLGLWLSVRCTTATRATVYVLVCFLAMWFLPVLLAPVLEPIFAVVVELLTGEPIDDAEEYVHAFSLPVGVWNGFFAWEDLGKMPRQKEFWAKQAFGLAAGVGYAAVAAVLWVGTVRAFQNEGKT